MSDDRWSRVSHVCQEALGRGPAERALYLDEACAGDVDLRREVEALLSREALAEGFLSTPPWTPTLDAGVAPDTPGGLRSVAGRTDAAPSLVPGARIGHYEVLQFVGAGGMGEVYRARDTRLDRVVALKRLPPALASDPGRVARFSREAKTLAQLNHPNICTLHDIVAEQGTTLLVMEYLEGQTLADWITQGPRPLPEILDAAAQIADGLAAAHTRGIVHRDLKPVNAMLVTSGAARPGVLTVKLLDFGLAKLRLPEADVFTSALETQTVDGHSTPGAVVGTVPYMSPEQIEGREVDGRTDLFSFGCVLYEMLTGHRAFTGGSKASVLSAVLTSEPTPVVEARPSTPPALQRLVEKCLAKNPDERWQTARDVADQLRWIAGQAGAAGQSGTGASEGPSPSKVRRVVRSARAHPWVTGAAVLALAAMSVALISLVSRQRQLAWVRNQALPELVRLAEARDYWPAFRLARQIEAVVPNEPTVKKLRPRFVGLVKRVIKPAGASVWARPRYGGEKDWVELGPVTEGGVPAPLGYSQMKVQAPGLEAREFATSVSEWAFAAARIRGTLALQKPGVAPDGMVLIENPQDKMWLGMDPFCSLAFDQTAEVGSFYADTREVTNRDYQRFVDAGGYRRREFWTEPFERDGKTLAWDEAMALLRDSTGRPGPATWEAGRFPKGAENLPVTGVSWYEAAAYARFAGKRLPSLYHFSVASGWFVGGDFVNWSNFSGKLAPVGSFRGSLNYWGLYDVAGNAREWCQNAAGRGRFALGGAADGPPYMLWNVDAAATWPAFQRNAMTGFRCIKLVTPGPEDARLDAAIPAKPRPDWSAMKPFSEDTWRMWHGLVSYTKGPLNAKVEWVDDSAPSWRMEKVTFNAAYDSERVIVYLFVPKHVPAPHQVVIFMQPGYGVFVSTSEDGRNTQDMAVWDYLVKDGRAVAYVIWKGIYERGGGGQIPDSTSLTVWVKPSQDLSRTIDYLETRKDLRADRVGYFGTSAAGDAGTLICANEKRLKAAVFQGAGLGGVDPFDREEIGFAYRCTTPVLMVNGAFDGYGQQPVFDALAAPPDRKRHLTFPSDHSLAGFTKEVMKANLEWFDRFLGPVR